MNRKVGTLYCTIVEWLAILYASKLGGNADISVPIYILYMGWFFILNYLNNWEEEHVRFKIRKRKSRDS